MYHAQPLGSDLMEVLDTLSELKRVIEGEAKARVKLEAEKAALSRRLSEALVAERRQRCRATASRIIAKRAQVATQPIIATYKEIASLKRELAAAKKKCENEKNMLEERIAFLQRENDCLREEREAALAAADFTHDLEPGHATIGDQVSSTAAIPTSPPPPPPPQVQMQGSGSQSATHSPALQSCTNNPWVFPPVPASERRSSHATEGNSLWTSSGQLTWNPPAVNLTSNRSRSQWRPTNRRPVSPARPQYLPVAGFRTATQMMAQEKENFTFNFESSQSRRGSKISDAEAKAFTDASSPSRAQVDDCWQVTRENALSCEVSQSQSDADQKRSQTPQSEDDCCIIIDCSPSAQDTNISEPPIKTEPENIQEIELAKKPSVATEKMLKKTKKKRKMYMKLAGDDLIM